MASRGYEQFWIPDTNSKAITGKIWTKKIIVEFSRRLHPKLEVPPELKLCLNIHFKGQLRRVGF